MSSPALTLAATLQRKAAKLGLPADLVSPELAAAQTPAAALSALAVAFEESPGVEAAGSLLWAFVEVLRSHDVDGEAALRALARAFRDRLATLERDAHAADVDVRVLDHASWRTRWDAD